MCRQNRRRVISAACVVVWFFTTYTVTNPYCRFWAANLSFVARGESIEFSKQYLSITSEFRLPRQIVTAPVILYAPFATDRL